MTAVEGTPTLLEATLNLIESRLLRVRTAMPARVEAWRPEDQAVDVLPLIRERIEVRPAVFENLDHPVVPMVPFCAALTVGGFTIQAAPAVGDVVLLLALDRDPDLWMAGPGDPQNAGSSRHHKLTDSIAFPMGLPRTGTPLPDIQSGELVIGRQDGAGELRVRQDGSIAAGARGATFRRAAREDDETTSSSTEDPAFWAWVTQVDLFIRALTGVTSGVTASAVGAAATDFNTSTGGSPPTSQTGRVSSGSDALEVE